MTPINFFPDDVSVFSGFHTTSISSKESVAFPINGETNDIRFGNPLRACDLLDFFPLLRRKKVGVPL